MDVKTKLCAYWEITIISLLICFTNSSTFQIKRWQGANKQTKAIFFHKTYDLITVYAKLRLITLIGLTFVIMNYRVEKQINKQIRFLFLNMYSILLNIQFPLKVAPAMPNQYWCLHLIYSGTPTLSSFYL